MSVVDLKVGSRVDWGHWKNGEVVQVGHGTVWVEFATPSGKLKHALRFDEVHPSAAHDRVRIGEFTVRHFSPGKLMIEAASGEAGEFDEAKLEGAIRRIWNRDF